MRHEQREQQMTPVTARLAPQSEDQPLAREPRKELQHRGNRVAILGLARASHELFLVERLAQPVTDLADRGRSQRMFRAPPAGEIEQEGGAMH
ncbi:MAG TPA: hypothetical protein VFA98_02330, partial [Thermoanaerobaculia bacterium]|nr:hypothetical protein [Thermoanaerobaculia bacterium]